MMMTGGCMKSRRNNFIVVLIVMVTGCVCYLYKDFQEKSSDSYAIDIMRKGDCEFLSFPDGSWLKTLIFDAGAIPPYHGHFRGAVYLMDSNGRVMKISGGYVKPKSFTYEMLTGTISRCQNVEDSLTNHVWKSVFPWFGKLPVQQIIQND